MAQNEMLQTLGTTHVEVAVLEAVEKPLVLMECLDKREPSCPYDSVCTQISVWDRAQSLLTNYLAGISLGSIADERGLKSRIAGAAPF